jgi:hypothetical protein
MDYLKVQDIMEYGGLAVFPLTLVSPAFEAKDSFEPLGKGELPEWVQAIETGRMNTVKIENNGETPVLALDGAILIGGAANRMLTASAIIRPGESVVLPAVSVEASRWDTEGLSGGATGSSPIPTFTSSDFAPASLRRERLEKAFPSMIKEGVSRVDQNMVWKHIENLFERSSIKTENFDICALYNEREGLHEEYASRIELTESQVGWVIFIDRTWWYLDLFYNHDVFADIFPNLLKSYAMEAVLTRVALDEEQDRRRPPELILAQDAFAKIKLIKINPLKTTERKSEGAGFFTSAKSGGVILNEGPALMHMAVCSRDDFVFQSPQVNVNNDAIAVAAKAKAADSVASS